MSEPRSIFLNPTEEEELYIRAIDNVFQKDSKQVISNSKSGHAVYLIHKFLENAVRSVKICTGRLAREVGGVSAYGDPKLAESAIKFLRKPDVQLSIIILDERGHDLGEGKGLDSHPFLKRICEESPTLKGTLTAYQVSQDWYKKLAFRHHFLVMDDIALRLEMHEKRADTSSTKAIATLHDKEFAESVADVFAWIRGNSTCLLTIPARA